MVLGFTALCVDGRAEEYTAESARNGDLHQWAIELGWSEGSRSGSYDQILIDASHNPGHLVQMVSLRHAVEHLAANTAGRNARAKVDRIGAEIKGEWESSRDEGSKQRILLHFLGALQILEQESLLQSPGSASEWIAAGGAIAGVGAGILCAYTIGDWSHAWVTVPMGLCGGAIPGVILGVRREIQSSYAVFGERSLVSIQLLERLARKSGFRSFSEMRHQMERQFRSNSGSVCTNLLST